MNGIKMYTNIEFCPMYMLNLQTYFFKTNIHLLEEGPPKLIVIKVTFKNFQYFLYNLFSIFHLNGQSVSLEVFFYTFLCYTYLSKFTNLTKSQEDTLIGRYAHSYEMSTIMF